MLKVLYALIPVGLVGIYYFGWRVLANVMVAALFCFLTEWVMTSNRNSKISTAVFVTAVLYGLSLPSTMPFWMTAVGAVVGILFAKEAFGGFGKNIFNPAIVARAFVYVCFPIESTSRFAPVFSGFPGGFSRWSYASLEKLPPLLSKTNLTVADAITAATPMWSRRDFGFVTSIRNLFLGNIGEVFSVEGNPQILAAGSAGEVCALVIVLAALYLIFTKTAQWRLMAATLLGAIVLNVFLRSGLGIEAVPPLPFTLFSGALLYATVFMVTDPVSAPKLPLSQWIYGIIIGMLMIFFRYKAIFAGGVAFSILLGNTVAPSLDLWIKRLRTAKKAEQK
ncbi:MAG: RnfABCDGE type electron transport complex subunit D [Fidelibacterota bacterium]